MQTKPKTETKPYEYYYLAKRNLLPNAALRSRAIGSLTPGSRVHVSAACGKAMASLTCMLAQSGYQVTASDSAFHPPMSDVLTSHNIPCLPFSANNVQGIDVLVPGNMLPPNALEVSAAREKNIPMLSGAEVLRELLVRDRRSLVVAGTHGKTTTSSLLTHVFLENKKDPAYMIGGSFQHTGESFSLGSDKTSHVIFEGDEYDCAYFDKAPKFLRYAPTSAIITSIEHDHIDLYPTFEDYRQAFQFLVDDMPAGGFLIIHESAVPHVDLSACAAAIITYGNSSASDAWFTVESVDEKGTYFSIHTKKEAVGETAGSATGETWSHIFVPLFGEYNIANTLSVFLIAMREGLASADIISALATYPGVHERQEVIGTKDTVTVIRDFAHHPTAVGLTLEGIRSHYPHQRIVCVFEPRSVTSRRKIFETEYPKVLAHADMAIIVNPPFRDNDNRADFMDVYAIQKELENMGKIGLTAEQPLDAITLLKQHEKEHDVVVFMSNGDFGGIPKIYLES